MSTNTIQKHSSVLAFRQAQAKVAVDKLLTSFEYVREYPRNYYALFPLYLPLHRPLSLCETGPDLTTATITRTKGPCTSRFTKLI